MHRVQNHQALQRRHDLKKEYTVVPFQKEKDPIPLVKHGFMGSGAKCWAMEWSGVYGYPLTITTTGAPAVIKILPAL